MSRIIRRAGIVVVIAIAILVAIAQQDRSTRRDIPEHAPTDSAGRDSSPHPALPTGSARSSERQIGETLRRAGVSQGEADEIVRTLDQVSGGGPFPHRKDGSVFQNRERRLPLEPSGYYREYTVRTPGSADRGARRLVIGSGGESYYTRDHYQTFIRLDDGGSRE